MGGIGDWWRSCCEKSKPEGGMILFELEIELIFCKLGALLIGSSVRNSEANFSAFEGPSKVNSGAAVASRILSFFLDFGSKLYMYLTFGNFRNSDDFLWSNFIFACFLVRQQTNFFLKWSENILIFGSLKTK